MPEQKTRLAFSPQPVFRKRFTLFHSIRFHFSCPVFATFRVVLAVNTRGEKSTLRQKVLANPKKISFNPLFRSGTLWGNSTGG